MTSHLCNETSSTPGFVCTCTHLGEQLPPRNICIPIPESQKIYVSTLLNISFSFVRWNDLNTPDKVREAILTNYPPDEVEGLVSGIFIDTAPLPGPLNLGKLKLLYILVFSENVTTRIKESLARRVLKLEELQAVTVRGENISIIDYIGLFDTEQQLKNANATNDAIDWCSSPSLFSCRNHSTCFDHGLRYTCPCKVGYYDNNNNECQLTVRLVNSTEPVAGRLEYMSGGEWRTVCQLGFTSLNADVTCRQLGLPSRGAVYYDDAVYGEGTGDVHMYRMTCTGRELALSQCPSEPLPPGSCNHSMDVSIRCDTVCVDDYHFGLNCSQPCVCNVSNTDVCDRDNGTCYCKAGWEGVTCDDDVDECRQTGACRGPLERCQNTQGSFLCLCEDEADRNEGGVCTGVRPPSDPEASSSVGVVLTAVLCSVGGAALVVVVVIICRVIRKRKDIETMRQRERACVCVCVRRTYLSTGKAELDGYDNPRHSGGHEEVYDEITDEVELSEEGTSDGYTRPDSVTVESLLLAKELPEGTEDSNHGYLTVTGDLSTAKTADFRSDRPELPLRHVTEMEAGDVSDNTGQVSSHDDGYLHPVAPEADKAGNLPVDDYYLHPIAKESDNTGQVLLSDDQSLVGERDSGASLHPDDDGYLHPYDPQNQYRNLQQQMTSEAEDIVSHSDLIDDDNDRKLEHPSA
ncbi:hypothetical protein C0Q70_13810 [Pomacea canaliculata]|uniref:Uncharacterized protein n=1 Tax=Pomacea canaliculata TaxID=400727 RepID=A0A2T7NY97_POMCA|nr:hypothetical protein C0Q70_13810 [Pomacea canaliculata]